MPSDSGLAGNTRHTQRSWGMIRRLGERRDHRGAGEAPGKPRRKGNRTPGEDQREEAGERSRAPARHGTGAEREPWGRAHRRARGVPEGAAAGHNPATRVSGPGVAVPGCRPTRTRSAAAPGTRHAVHLHKAPPAHGARTDSARTGRPPHGRGRTAGDKREGTRSRGNAGKQWWSSTGRGESDKGEPLSQVPRPVRLWGRSRRPARRRRTSAAAGRAQDLRQPVTRPAPRRACAPLPRSPHAHGAARSGGPPGSAGPATPAARPRSRPAGP